AANGGGDAGGEVAVGDQLDARARFADAHDEIVVALAVEHRDGQLMDVAVERLGHALQVLFDGRGEVHRFGGGRPDDDFVHVDVGRVEEAAFFGCRNDGDRVRGTGRTEVRPFEGIDGDVDFRINLAFRPSAPEGLADVEHGRLVALSLADGHRAALF